MENQLETDKQATSEKWDFNPSLAGLRIKQTFGPVKSFFLNSKQGYEYESGSFCI